ncbi:unnamed protein product [Haemonchus placei]|uniref:Transposase n=1 Tax=Haemonchus placei TaxID=6290 RepID=A0A0N4WJP3_HAEPC|nr:unnamed protein product [Haemonchus placei]
MLVRLRPWFDAHAGFGPVTGSPLADIGELATQTRGKDTLASRLMLYMCEGVLRLKGRIVVVQVITAHFEMGYRMDGKT